MTAPFSKMRGRHSFPYCLRAVLTTSLAAKACGCWARLWRATAILWFASQWRSAANLTSAGSTLGPHTPVEQHIGGSKTSTLFMSIPSSFRRKAMMPIQKRLNDRHQSLQLSKRFVVDAISNARPVLAAANQPRVLQDSEVLGNRRLRERQFVDDLTAHASLFPR